ncbi:MAG: class I SAM-dependent methyltransferase [Clostridia bacterium]|nr:class I SAM-dependent methyltransferase [Clostridia bacterium]
MTAYSGFAKIYDAYMQAEDYDRWLMGIQALIKEYGVPTKHVLELACGSGAMSVLLAKQGYDVIGLDISEEMLMVAKDKALEERVRIGFFQQDMVNYELNNTFDTVLCICDGMNYVLEEEDLESVFERVHHSLTDKGLFIFDISTYYKLKYILGESTIAESREDSAFIWENFYDEDESILSFELTVFTEENGVYRRSDEVHEQRAYKIADIKRLSEDYFEWMTVVTDTFDVIDVKNYDEETMTNERVFFVLKKK